MNPYERYRSVHKGLNRDFCAKEYEIDKATYARIYGRYLPESKDARILDIGSGIGKFLYFLREAGYRRYYGIDMSPENVAFVKEHVTDLCHRADMREFLQQSTQPFDCIVMNEVLEHIDQSNGLACLRAINAALAPGGTLITLVPNMENPFAGYLRWYDLTHATGFTRHSLGMALRLSGFTDIQVLPFEHVTGSVKWRIRKAVRRIVHRFLRSMFQYDSDTVPFVKRIFAVARKGVNS